MFSRWRWRLFGLKAALLVLLGRWSNHGWLKIDDPKRHDDIDEVSYLWVHDTYSHDFGRGGEFGVVSVARGWRHWHVHYVEDGWP